MPETTLVGVRVHSWQWRKFCRWAEMQHIAPGQALTDVIQEFLSAQNLPQPLIESWLIAYREEHREEHR